MSSVPSLQQRTSRLQNVTEVSIHAGFTEHAYRLVFNFEDRYGPAHLTTVLPCGTVENEKDLKAEKGKGLIAYTFPQTMTAEVAQNHKGLPFVWTRTDGTSAVVQTWPTSYNEKFITDFNPKTTNPDPAKFKPQAVDEFKQAMENLFGHEARRHEILYCHKVTENTKPVYFGTSELLLKYLHEEADIRKSLDITEMTRDGGFVARSVDGKGKEGSKSFKFSPGKQYALYTKQGWETMACITPLDQFNDGRTYPASCSTWATSSPDATAERDGTNDKADDGEVNYGWPRCFWSCCFRRGSQHVV